MSSTLSPFTQCSRSVHVLFVCIRCYERVGSCLHMHVLWHFPADADAADVCDALCSLSADADADIKADNLQLMMMMLHRS